MKSDLPHPSRSHTDDLRIAHRPGQRPGPTTDSTAAAGRAGRLARPIGKPLRASSTAPSGVNAALRCVVVTCAIVWLEPAAAVQPLTVPGQTSTVFSLTVDGVPVPVLAYKDIHYAQAVCTGPAEVDVALSDGTPVQSATVQPARHGIRPTWKASHVEFVSTRPVKMVVQIDFLPKLFLFFETPEAVAPPAPGATIVDAVQAGARPDGLTDSTEAVQRAIDGLPADGVLRFPPGHYRTGSLRMRSNTTLRLDAGALLQALDRHDSVRPLPASPDMIAYIQACNVTNLTISGPGTIDANGYVVRRGWEAAEKIRKKPGRALAIAGCRGVRIRDVTVRDSYSWNVHAFLSDDLEIRNLKILSDVRLSNHDGIDIDRCNNVLVEDCFIFSEDDGLSPKARPGRAVVENLTFRNCILWAHKANGIRIGSETDCDVMRNFLFENIDILAAADGIRLDCTRGAQMENIVFRDVRMEAFLEHYDPRYERNRERPPAHASRSLSLLVACESGGRPPGRIDGVVFENVHWDDARVPVRVEISEPAQKRAAEAGPGALIRNVVLRNCTRAGVPVRSAKDCGVSTNEPLVDAFRFEFTNVPPPNPAEPAGRKPIAP